jgi:tetratricopeptide (TPR) repeat protein
MKVCPICFQVVFFFLLSVHSSTEAQTTSLWGELKPGIHEVGFKLMDARDQARVYFTREDPGGRPMLEARPVRIYLWYPAKEITSKSMQVGDYARMAAEDFRLNLENMPMPIPLSKGLDQARLKALLKSDTAAIQNAIPAEGSFPLLILGQGLYYESPFTQIILCEYLASNGYVVATCPLIGTCTRLVNLDAGDLESQIRDMEFTLSLTRVLPYADSSCLGLIGYDLGGMSGLTLAMRNPDVDAFLSLDSGILFGHYSELPQSHPHYKEANFLIPWMHMTQSRFVPAEGTQGIPSSLMERKAYGDSYLLLFDTTHHGDFTSYAVFGIQKPVPGYWDRVTKDSHLLHKALCEYGLAFFDAYLKENKDARALLQKSPKELGLSKTVKEIRRKKGKSRPPLQDELVSMIIDGGVDRAMPKIKEAVEAHPDRILFEEKVLNWLGYHFLYWWGREEEAVEVFQLNVQLFPDSANTHDSLGEAYAVIGKLKDAIKSYQKSLDLDPNNDITKEKLNRLKAEK